MLWFFFLSFIQRDIICSALSNVDSFREKKIQFELRFKRSVVLFQTEGMVKYSQFIAELRGWFTIVIVIKRSIAYRRQAPNPA